MPLQLSDKDPSIMSASTEPGTASSRTTGEYSLRKQLDALASGKMDNATFLRNTLQRFRVDADESWEVLSLLDQYHRLGKIKADAFQEIKTKIAEYAMGSMDVAAASAAPPAVPPAPTTPAAASVPAPPAPPASALSPDVPATPAAPAASTTSAKLAPQNIQPPPVNAAPRDAPAANPPPAASAPPSFSAPPAVSAPPAAAKINPRAGAGAERGTGAEREPCLAQRLKLEAVCFGEVDGSGGAIKGRQCGRYPATALSA